MRNMKKQREQGRQIAREHKNADMAGMELTQLRDSFHKKAQEKGINEAIYDLICDAFYSGVAIGYRTGKKDSTK